MIIEISNLTKKYGKFKALDNVNFSVEKGEIHGFLGPNGAGKSTTIRIMLGFIEKSMGNILMWGDPVSKENIKHRKKIGYLPSDIAYPVNMTGEEIIDFAMSIRGENGKARKDRLVKRLDIDLSKKIKECSKGMKQKIGIIQAILHEPELIILDEPTTGLDPLMQKVFNSLMIEESKKGTTVLMSSHILSDVETICDRVTMIRKGTIVMTEKMEEIKKKKTKRATIRFRGNAINLAECEGVSNLKQDNKTIMFDITDNINPVMAKLANIDIENITIEALSLEEIFMKHYNIGGSK